MAKPDVKLKISVKDYTTTELISQLHTLNIRDRAINDKMAATLRKLADGIDSGKIGVTAIESSARMAVGDFPGAKFSIEFFDREHEEKTRNGKK